jgi:hypothetical protein
MRFSPGRVSPRQPARERKNAMELEEALSEITDIVKKIRDNEAAAAAGSGRFLACFFS